MGVGGASGGVLIQPTTDWFPCNPALPYWSTSAGGSLSGNPCQASFTAGRVFDVWQAWLDGTWTSQITFTIGTVSAVNQTGAMTLGISTTYAPGDACVSKAVVAGGTTCAPVLWASAAIYEDGLLYIS